MLLFIKYILFPQYALVIVSITNHLINKHLETLLSQAADTIDRICIIY